MSTAGVPQDGDSSSDVEDASPPPETLEPGAEHHAAIARLGMLALRHQTDNDELVRSALDELVRLVPCRTAALLRVEGDKLVIWIASDPRLEGAGVARAGSLCDLALRAGRLVVSDGRVGASGKPPRTWLGGSGESTAPGWAVPLSGYGRERVLTCVAAPDATVSPTGTTAVEAVATVLSGSASRRRIEAELRVSEQRFRRMAEHVPDAVFRLRLTPVPRVEYVSPRFSHLTGLPPEVLDRDPWAWRRCVPPEDRAALAPLYSLEDDEVVTTSPYRVVRPDGSIRWVETRVAPERDTDGQLIAVSGVTRDITARRETEDALRRALEREQEATEQLRELSELKNALMAAVSHELRTPLTAVMGFAELLGTTEEALGPERRAKALSALQRNARRLEQLLGDLLDLDRLDRGIVEPVRRPTDIAGLVELVVGRVERSTVDVDVEPRVINIDGPKIERVLENLLGNAIKHTREGTRVWIRSSDDDDGVTITVEDDGPGVPDSVKSAVFEPFERGSVTAAPGTGIGLSLVRRFVELHDGRAWVDDRPGGGAAFSIWLPDVEETTGEGFAPMAAAPHGEPSTAEEPG